MGDPSGKAETMETRSARVYRLGAAEALEAILGYVSQKGLSVPKSIEGGRVDVENGVVVVTVIDASIPEIPGIAGPSMVT